jgi:hypothetical protein
MIGETNKISVLVSPEFHPSGIRQVANLQATAIRALQRVQLSFETIAYEIHPLERVSIKERLNGCADYVD